MQTEILIPALMIVTWLVGRVPYVKSSYLPYAAIALGATSQVLLGDKAANIQQAIQGAVEGLAASGLWSAAGKHVMQRKAEPKPKR